MFRNGAADKAVVPAVAVSVLGKAYGRLAQQVDRPDPVRIRGAGGKAGGGSADVEITRAGHAGNKDPGAVLAGIGGTLHEVLRSGDLGLFPPHAGRARGHRVENHVIGRRGEGGAVGVLPETPVVMIIVVRIVRVVIRVAGDPVRVRLVYPDGDGMSAVRQQVIQVIFVAVDAFQVIPRRPVDLIHPVHLAVLQFPDEIAADILRVGISGGRPGAVHRGIHESPAGIVGRRGGAGDHPVGPAVGEGVQRIGRRPLIIAVERPYPEVILGIVRQAGYRALRGGDPGADRYRKPLDGGVIHHVLAGFGSPRPGIPVKPDLILPDMRDQVRRGVQPFDRRGGRGDGIGVFLKVRVPPAFKKEIPYGRVGDAADSFDPARVQGISGDGGHGAAVHESLYPETGAGGKYRLDYLPADVLHRQRRLPAGGVVKPVAGYPGAGERSRGPLPLYGVGGKRDRREPGQRKRRRDGGLDHAVQPRGKLVVAVYGPYPYIVARIALQRYGLPGNEGLPVADIIRPGIGGAFYGISRGRAELPGNENTFRRARAQLKAVGRQGVGVFLYMRRVRPLHGRAGDPQPPGIGFVDPEPGVDIKVSGRGQNRVRGSGSAGGIKVIGIYAGNCRPAPPDAGGRKGHRGKRARGGDAAQRVERKPVGVRVDCLRARIKHGILLVPDQFDGVQAEQVERVHRHLRRGAVHDIVGFRVQVSYGYPGRAGQAGRRAVNVV